MELTNPWTQTQMNQKLREAANMLMLGSEMAKKIPESNKIL